jgi:hypothetical protein
MRETLHTEIALEALTMAIVRQRPPPGLIHHSERRLRPVIATSPSKCCDDHLSPGSMPLSLIGWPSRDQPLHLR